MTVFSRILAVSAAFLLSSQSMVVAQVQYKKASPVDQSTYETHLDALNGFLDATNAFTTAYPDPGACAFDNFVNSLAHGFTLEFLEAPKVAEAGPIAIAIAIAASQVKSLITDAKNSGCSTKNDLCCKKPSDPSLNDSCETKTGNYCKLTGFKPVGCTSNSDGC